MRGYQITVTPRHWHSLVPVPMGTENDLLEELAVLGDMCIHAVGLLVPECNMALAL